MGHDLIANFESLRCHLIDHQSSSTEFFRQKKGQEKKTRHNNLMKSEKVLLVFLLVALMANAIVAQQCEQFDESPQACQGLLSSHQIFTAASLGLTQQSLEAQLWNVNPLTNASLMSPVAAMPYECATYYLRLICGTAFMRCDSVPTGQVGIDGEPVFVVIPHRPCKSVCRDVNEVCGALFRGAGLPPLDCNQLSPLDGTEQWPEFNSTAPPQQCEVWPVEDMGTVDYECPAPFEFVAPLRDPNTGLPCAWLCKDQNRGFFQDGYGTVFTMTGVLGWLSMAGSIYISVTYAVFPPMRAFPRRLVLCIALSLIVYMIGLVGSNVQGEDDFACSDEVTLSYTGTCRGLGGISIYGSYMSASYWWVQIVVLFHNVALGRKPENLFRWEWLIHAWCVLMPLAMTLIIAYIGDQRYLGTSGSLSFCNLANTPKWLPWSLLHSYLLFYLATGIVMMTGVLWRFARHTGTKAARSYRRNMVLQLLIFGLYYLGVLIIVVAIQAYATDEGDALSSSVTDFYTCVLSGGGDACNELLYDFSPALVYFFTVFVSIQGIVLFIVFGVLSEVNRKLWPTLCRNVAQGRSLFDSIGTTTASGTTGGSSSRRSTAFADSGITSD
jgi:Frizzled/Smoothened family membrane region